MSAVTLPFRAAIFDLDGTLLDSLGVWREIGRRFFAAHGMAVPERFGLEVAGMSYHETAEYTVRNYLKELSPEALVEEWIWSARDEYAQRVRPVKGAVAYVRMLKRMGVKLAVATALPETLYMPCLQRLGIDVLFDALCSTEQTGSGKADSAVYRMAADRLRVPCGQCAVFEDVLPGLQGAKRAGMRAYQVRQTAASPDWPAMAAVADGVIDSFDDMRRCHPFDARPRCVVFAAWCEGDPARAYDAAADDLVLCADGGWEIALRAGIEPDLVIGDFDSSEKPEGVEVQVHPVMKDDTDTMLCLREGLRRGYDRFLIVGGMGGRLDHTLANLQSMAFAKRYGADAEMCDGHTWCTVLENEERTIPCAPGHMSVFALSDVCEGVSIRGAKYELENGRLTNCFPLGVSNTFEGREVTVRVRKGMALVMTTGEEVRSEE